MPGIKPEKASGRENLPLPPRGIKELLTELYSYDLVYDSLNPELQDRWDKVREDAIGVLMGDPAPDVDAPKAEANLREFLKFLEKETKEKAN